MAIEPILADELSHKGRAMFLVAKCQVASAASCEPLKKAEGRKAYNRFLGKYSYKKLVKFWVFTSMWENSMQHLKSFHLRACMKVEVKWIGIFNLQN